MSAASPTGAASQPEARAAANFLWSVFHGQERGVVSLFFNPSRMSFFAPLDRNGWHHEAAAAAMRARETQNVYYAIGVQAASLAEGRGQEISVVALPGLWADLDVQGPNHAAIDLPPTIEDAWSIVRTVPFKPTVVVYTGGGMQAYWLFRESWEFESDTERRAAKNVIQDVPVISPERRSRPRLGGGRYRRSVPVASHSWHI